MKTLKNTINIVAKVLLITSVISLAAGIYYLYTNQQEISKKIELLQGSGGSDSNLDVQILEDCNQSCREEIAKAVSDALSDIPSITTETIVEKETIVIESQGTDYIPMGTSATTTSTDWVDVDDSAVYIDLENDYGGDATVSWEASLKVAHGNGQVFARLYDDTNKIAVDFSELSTENNVEFSQRSSGNLPFWKGRNLYRVQIKSLNSFEVTYSGGRIKVSN